MSKILEFRGKDKQDFDYQVVAEVIPGFAFFGEKLQALLVSEVTRVLSPFADFWLPDLRGIDLTASQIEVINRKNVEAYGKHAEKTRDMMTELLRYRCAEIIAKEAFEE